MLLAIFKAKLFRFAVAAMLLFPAVVCAGATEWKGREVTRSGKLHVQNPRTPMESAVSYETTEIWRRGGDDDDEVLFGMIGDVVRDPQGNSYLLDSQICQVDVFSPDGAYLRSIGREGEGPGEFRMPADVTRFSDGTLCVLQVMPDRAVLMTSEGEAVGDHPLPKRPDGSRAFLQGGLIAQDQLILKLSVFVRRETSIGLTTEFVKIDRDGNVTARFWEQFREQDLGKITFEEKTDAEPVWTAGPGGRFYINNDWDSYYVEVYEPDGTLAHVIERDYEHRKRTERDFADMQGLMDGGQISPETELSDTSRDVVRIVGRDGGEVWVLSSRGERDNPDGTIATFDVFDKDGRFVRQASIDGPMDAHSDVFHLVGDFVFVVTNASDFAGAAGDDSESGTESSAASAPSTDAMEVICLRMDKKS